MKSGPASEWVKKNREAVVWEGQVDTEKLCAQSKSESEGRKHDSTPHHPIILNTMVKSIGPWCVKLPNLSLSLLCVYLCALITCVLRVFKELCGGKDDLSNPLCHTVVFWLRDMSTSHETRHPSDQSISRVKTRLGTGLGTRLRVPWCTVYRCSSDCSGVTCCLSWQRAAMPHIQKPHGILLPMYFHIMGRLNWQAGTNLTWQCSYFTITNTMDCEHVFLHRQRGLNCITCLVDETGKFGLIRRGRWLVICF